MDEDRSIEISIARVDAFNLVLFNQSFFFEKQRKRTHHDLHDTQMT